MKQITLLHGDCLKLLPTLADNSIDCVIADLPYGCLNRRNIHAQWDNVLDLSALWEELLRVTTDNAAIILFGKGIFSAQLIMSQPKLYRYSLVWDKQLVTGFLDANRKPMSRHEDILVFYKKQPTYNPQMTIGAVNHSRGKAENSVIGGGANRCYGSINPTPTVITNEKYPTSIISISKRENPRNIHPTQKPVALLEYLIKTYSNEGDTILDCTMGSGTTMVACVRTGRKGIGIELLKEYFDIASSRVEIAKEEKRNNLFYIDNDCTETSVER